MNRSFRRVMKKVMNTILKKYLSKYFLLIVMLILILMPAGDVLAAKASQTDAEAESTEAADDSEQVVDTGIAMWNSFTVRHEGDGLCTMSIINPAVGRHKISEIYFYTWSDEGYKNDLYRYRGLKVKNERSGVWSASFNGNTHSSSGLYCTEVRAVSGGEEMVIGTFFFRNDFSMEKHHGWIERNGRYFFYDREKQVMKRGGVQDGITIKDDGSAVMTAYSKEKLPVLVRAAEVVDEICEPGDSLNVKKDKCYKYVVSFPYLMKDYGVGDYVGKWSCLDAHYANNILNAYGDQGQCGGECVAEAAALAYLFVELDFGDVYLYTNEVHGWVYADGRYYDPNNSSVNGPEKWFNTSTYVTYATNTYLIN